jgi:hypothetical protein
VRCGLVTRMSGNANRCALGRRQTAIGQAILGNGASLHKTYVERFERAKAESDLPEDSNPEALARSLDLVGQGLSIEATCGAT